jgi:CheY-like chemotaxis protein/glycine cleavage system H lipoate-binding protein
MFEQILRRPQMAEQLKMLVVDDEEAICEGCSRIFTRQGFDVSKSNNPQDGLERASAEDYHCILLDIKMPQMSGLEFLSKLRDTHRNTPVILMTGYPSTPNAISAVRLGASGFVTKPFTPEEITQTVQRFVSPQVALDAVPSSSPAESTVSQPEATPERRFWDKAWIAAKGEDEYRVGVLTPKTGNQTIAEVTLPGIGQVVYQGLPMAAVRLESGESITVPAPLTGVVNALNDQLAEQPELVATQPCSNGWLADIRATRVDDEIRHCSTRRVLVVSEDQATAAHHQEQLASFGCEVNQLTESIADAGSESLSQALLGHQYGVVLLDATSLGDEGPRMVAQIQASAPSAKVIVVAASNEEREAEYRSQKILYYAVGEVDSDEMLQVLDSAFQTPPKPSAKPPKGTAGNEPIASITITNRQGSHVMLMIEPGMLHRNKGLGVRIRGLLYEQLFPIKTVLGKDELEPKDILHATKSYDRVIHLTAKELQLLPGTLVRDTGTELTGLSSSEGADKVTTLVIQRAKDSDTVDDLPDRTLDQLARHIANIMATA